MFPNFEDIQKANRERGQAARMAADDGVKPELGRYYTVSPNFSMGDRSWTDDIWKPIAISGPNLLVEIRSPWRWERVEHRGLFMADERAWYPADEVVDAIEAGDAPA